MTSPRHWLVSLPWRNSSQMQWQRCDHFDVAYAVMAMFGARFDM